MRSLFQTYRNTIRNPKYRGWVILGTLIYLLSPIDLSPDVFPFVGQIDDVVVLMLFVTEMVQLAADWGKPQSFESAQTDSKKEEGETIDVEATPLD